MTVDRLVVITNGNYFARIILDGLLEAYREKIAGIIVVGGDYKARTGLKAVFAIGRATCFPYFWYKIITYIAFAVAQRLFPSAPLSVERRAADIGIPVKHCVAVNSEEVRVWAAELKPDLVVSVSCPQRIGKALRELGQAGSINIHSSLLPSYAGLAPYYWVLSHGEAETGTTVHFMTRKFDDGHILAQERTSIGIHESAFSLFVRLSHLGRSALLRAVDLAMKGEGGSPQDLSRYSYYSHPDSRSYLSLKKQGHAIFRWGELFSVLRNEVRATRSTDTGRATTR